jgi:hypothetical protein
MTRKIKYIVEIRSVSILNYSANYKRCTNKGFSKNPIFIGKNNYVPEIESLLSESRMFYKTIYNRPDSIVKIPQMSPSSIIIEDSLPICSPHLLLMYNDKFMYSLAEKYNNVLFHNDFKTIFNTLTQLYPEQNIIFFEHGSGNKNINGQNKKVNAGKSVTVAHGHFCVMPTSPQSFFDVIFSQTKDILSENNWKNITKVPIIDNESVPDSYTIFKDFTDKNYQNKPPYIVICEYDSKNNHSKTAIFIQQNIEAQTPSQCLRKIIAESVLKERNPLYWDWKKFFSVALNGNRSEFIQKRIEQVQQASIDFENKLNRLIVPKFR